MHKLFLLTVSVSSLVFGQVWQGYILTDREAPLPYVYIFHPVTGTWTTSDNYGYFTLSGTISINDSIRFSRLGYHPKTIILTAQTELVIYLNRNPIVLDPINQTGSKQEFRENPTTFVITKNPAQGHIEHRQLLTGIPGLMVRTYGGPGSIGTLSLDGGSSSQTKIIMDGFDLTNAQNGVTDLSQLPLTFIGNVRYLPDSNNLFGSGSADGIVSLNPWNHDRGFSLSTGSYGHRAITAKYRHDLIGGSIQYLVGQRKDDGDYPVQWRDQHFNRKNNFFKQQFSAARFQKLWPTSLYLQLLYLNTVQERGLPGLIWSPSRAYRDDHLLLLGSTFGWFTRFGEGQLKWLIKNAQDQYQYPLFAVNSKHTIRSHHVVLGHSFHPHRKIQLSLQSEISFDNLRSSESGTQRRMIYGQNASLEYHISKKILIKPHLRIDYWSSYFQEPIYAVDLIYNRPQRILRSVVVHSGQSIRFPTFNELYWSPGGNPNLKPEHTTAHSVQIQFQTKQFGDLRFRVFNKTSQDLIQWIPLLTYWQPVNIKQVERSGWKLMWHRQGSTVPFEGYLSFSGTTTSNKNPGDHYGKPLQYAPHNIATISTTWTPGRWTFYLQGHYVSQVISRYDWPQDIILPQTSLVTISAGYTYPNRYGELITTLAIDNITDRAYESSQGYPEPGRNYRITLIYAYN